MFNNNLNLKGVGQNKRFRQKEEPPFLVDLSILKSYPAPFYYQRKALKLAATFNFDSHFSFLRHFAPADSPGRGENFIESNFTFYAYVSRIMVYM